MERKEITTKICCETAKEKKGIDANPKKKQVTLTVQSTESAMALKTTTIAATRVIKANNEEPDLSMTLQGRKKEDREFKDEEGGYEDDQEDNAVEDVEEDENVFKHREEEREFVEEKGGYEDDQEDNIEDAEDENGFTEMDEEGGYKDEDVGEEC
jgi:hypothetical protein